MTAEQSPRAQIEKWQAQAVEFGQDLNAIPGVSADVELHVEWRGAIDQEVDHSGARIVSERYWCGGKYPVCCVVIRDPIVGLKAYIAGTESSWFTRWHGTRVDPELAKVLFPAYASQAWAEW